MEINKIIRKAISCCFVIFAIVIKAQDTFSEFDKTNEGFEIEKIKNADLKLIKEIIRDKSGKVLKYYNYNPATGELDGDFDNGMFKGNYNNKRISSDNYIHFLNPSNSNEVLLITGKIISGKLDGRYNIIQRLYDTETQYDHNSTIINSYIKGEYTKSYATYVNRNKFNDKIVGEVVFSNGLYSSFALIYKGKKYLANYKDGLLDYYVAKDSENNRAIDSIKVGGRIYLKQGEFKKNVLPSIADSLNKIIEPSGSDFNYEKMGLKNLSVSYVNETQAIPTINLLNFEFNIVNRKVNFPTNNGYWFVRYFSKSLTQLYFIPCTDKHDDVFIIGIVKNRESYQSIPTDLKIKKCYSDDYVSVPLFEYTINLKEIVDLYGTINGYDYLNKEIYRGVGYEHVLNLSTMVNKSKAELVEYSNIEEKIICSNEGQKMSYVGNLISERRKIHEEENSKKVLQDQLVPKYPGDIPEMVKFINQNLQYPSKARQEGISGKCYLELFINENGDVTEVKVIKGLQNCQECDDEAIRVAKKMKWIPPETGGIKHSSTFKMPFTFKIQ